MFEIPDDDDLFSEDNLRDILNEASHSTEQQNKSKTDTNNSNVLHHSGSTKTTAEVGQNLEEGFGRPQNKRARVLADMNYQLKTENVTVPEKTITEWEAVEGRTPTVCCTNSRLQANQLTPAQLTQPLEPDAAVLPRRRSQRKFPGPAGILPPAKPTELASVLRKGLGVTPEVPVDSTTSKAEEPEEEVCSSQASGEVFASPAWQMLLADLEPCTDDVLRKFSVQAMLHKASRRLLPKGKVPLMLGVLDSIDFQGTDASVVLRDRTGQMQGTLHRDVFKDFSADLQAGAAVVLRQVSVISPSSRTHYLNITAANIVAVYPATSNQVQDALSSSPEKSSTTRPSQQTMKDFVHAAEMELLEAANAAKEAALSKIRQQGSATPGSSSAPPFAGSKFNQRSPGLFSHAALHAPRDGSPSLFTPQTFQRARTPSLPRTPLAGGFPVRSAGSLPQMRAPSSLSQARTPSSGLRASTPGVNSGLANISHSTGTPSSVANSTGFSHRHPASSVPVSSFVQMSSTPSRFGGTASCTVNSSQAVGAGIQPPTPCTTTSSTNQAAFRRDVPSGVQNSQAGTAATSRLGAPTATGGSCSTGHPRLGNEPVASTGVPDRSQPHTIKHAPSSQAPQQSKWSFKRSLGPPASAAAASNPDSDKNPKEAALQHASSGEPLCKVRNTNDAPGSNRTGVSVQMGGAGARGSSATSMICESVGEVKRPAARVSSNMWDDELSDDILSQLSEDF